MATATITYDGRNKTARSIMQMIRSLDIFTVTEPQKESKDDPTLMSKDEYFAMLDRSKAQVAEGKVYRFDDRNKMMDWLNSL